VGKISGGESNCRTTGGGRMCDTKGKMGNLKKGAVAAWIKKKRDQSGL